MSAALRVYENAGPDGYPPEWHDLGDGVGIKHVVRRLAGDRCERCKHPYTKGDGQYSRCDEHCTHGNPVRWQIPLLEPDWIYGLRPRHGGSDTDKSTGGYVGWAIEEGYTVEARWRILTVHHLNGDKRDCRWWNLAALCQRCHLVIQGRVRMEQVWPHEHSEWFKPHAAGYYAWAYLGLELDHAETLARIDELLELERVA